MREAIGSIAKGFAFPTGRLFWLLSIAYECFMAFLLQKGILPLWPEMHAGHGLLINELAFLLVVLGLFDPVQSRRNLTNRTSDGFHRYI